MLAVYVRPAGSEASRTFPVSASHLLRTAGVRDVCYPLLIITKILKFQTLVLVFAQHALDLLSYLSNHVQLNIVVDS